VQPASRVNARLVGLIQLGSDIVEDDIDRAAAPPVIFTPAFTAPVAVDSSASIFAIKLAHGRQLWVLFARSIYVVPEPTVPVVSVAAVAVGSIILANLVAAVPGRLAGRTPAALVLRAE